MNKGNAVVVEPQNFQDGFVRLKPEYIISKLSEIVETEKKDEDDSREWNKKEQKQTDNFLPKKPKRQRGINRGREQAMAQAKRKNCLNTVRLCNSVVREGGKCKFSSRCNAFHSLKEFWAQRPADLGDFCPLFDTFGKCSFGASCRYASAHTDSTTLLQIVKDPKRDLKTVLNANRNEILLKMRKKQYDFSRADKITGSVCRETPKLDMKTLTGKRYLAPLTTVGNLPFRRLCVELGAEVTCGEMAVATGLLQGFASDWSLLKRHSTEKYFGVQIAGGFADTLSRTTQMIVDECEVDFIDLNLGCPLDAINDKSGGCALANRSNRCVEALSAMNLVARNVPITTKLRYGMTQGNRTSHHLMRSLLNINATQLITLHPRSKEQRYTKLAEWDYVPQCVKAVEGRCPLWVCGDVMSYDDYYKRLETPGVSGVMIGRGALIKPWLFTEIEERRHWDISASERLDLIRNDYSGVETTRRFMLEWLSFQYRYIPVGILEQPPQKINERPPFYKGRNEMETLLASPASSNWVKITEMFLGKTPDGFLFVPKHNASAY